MRVSEAFRQAPTPDEGAGAVPHEWPAPAGEFGPPAPSRTALLDPRTAKGFEVTAEDIKDLTRLATDKAIVTAEEAGLLNKHLEKATAALKQLEVWQKAALEPVKAKEKAIRALFKPLITALEDGFIPRAKQLVNAWVHQEEARVARVREASRRAAEEAARKEAEAIALAEAAETSEERDRALEAAEVASAAQSQALVAAPVEAPRGLKGDMGTTTIKHPWRFEVVKPDLVPRQYLKVDEPAIRKAVAAGVREISGVNIFQGDEVAVRLG